MAYLSAQDWVTCFALRRARWRDTPERHAEQPQLTRRVRRLERPHAAVANETEPGRVVEEAEHEFCVVRPHVAQAQAFGLQDNLHGLVSGSQFVAGKNIIERKAAGGYAKFFMFL
jgi:hypothetical protein